MKTELFRAVMFAIMAVTVAIAMMVHAEWVTHHDGYNVARDIAYFTFGYALFSLDCYVSFRAFKRWSERRTHAG